MPRQSANAATFSPTETTRAVLRAPPDLDQLEREMFDDIVSVPHRTTSCRVTRR